MATLYKVLPMARIEWRDVWLGAFVTAILFIIGKEALSLYLARAGVGSAYGAAGSLVVLLVWLFYTYQVLIFGAEFTQVHAKRAGRQIVASRGAHLHTREEGACKQRGTDQEPPAAATEPGPEEPPAALLSRRWRRAEDLACIGFGMAMGWLAALLLRRH